jgi:hypothetical protein
MPEEIDEYTQEEGDSAILEVNHLDDEEFLTHCQEQLQDAKDFLENHLAPHRSDAIDVYHQKEYGDEEQGRSQYVDSTLRDTVNSILPSLLKIFTSSERVLEFMPRQPEDEPFALQATDYVRHCLNESNFYNVLHDAMKDALVVGSGFVKYFYEYAQDVEGYSYTGLDDDTLAALMQDNQIEISSIDSRPIASGSDMSPEEMPMIHDIEVKRRSNKGKFRLECIPPEEILFNRRSKGFDDPSTDLIAHRKVVTVSDLVSLGFEKDDFIDFAGDNYDLDNQQESYARRPQLHGKEGVAYQEASKKLLFTELYIKCDYDLDDFTEVRRVCIVGPNFDKILMNEPVNGFPFVHFTPYREPHDVQGAGLFDILRDVQKTKTQVMRGMLDSLSLSIFPRMSFIDGQVSVSDLMNVETGALIRMRTSDAVKPLTVPFVGAAAEGILNYFSEVTENRTGISKASLGLDPSSLMSSSPIAVSGTLSAAQLKIEYIARNFAETALKPLYQGILKLIVQHQDRETMIRLRNEWIPMNPAAWDTGYDVMINVALGGGDENLRMQALQTIATKQEEIIKLVGPDNPLVNVQQYSNTLRKMTELSGFKNSEEFFKDPSKEPPREPEPEQPSQEEIQMQMMQMQVELAKGQLELDQMRLQLDEEKAQTDAAIKTAEIETDAAIKLQELSAKYNQSIDTTQLRGMIETNRELIRQQGLLEAAKINKRGE